MGFFLFYFALHTVEASCFSRHQLFKMQNSSMQDIDLFLKSEGWKLIDSNSGIKSSSGLLFRWFVYTKGEESTLEIFNSGNSGNIVSFKTSVACFQNISLQQFNDFKGSIEPWYNRVSIEFRDKDQIIHFHDFVTTELSLPQIFVFNDNLKDQLANLSVVYKTKDQNELLVNKIEEEKEREKNAHIFDVVETQPNPPGGMSGWNKYLSDNLKYPTQARRMGTEGSVIVVFVINTDGSIQDVEVLRGIGGGCDEEAVKVVQNGPKWEPGKQRGRLVRTRMRLEIRFRLS
jgi:TonB family protein